MRKDFSVCILFITLFGCQLSDHQRDNYLTGDGAWSWFSDPRAILVENQVVTGWVTADGTVEAAKFDLSTRSVQTCMLYHKLEKDDHDNPAFALTSTGKILAAYTKHSAKDLFINVLEDHANRFEFGNARLIQPVSEEELEKFPRETVTYANPVQLTAEENKLYCFGRYTGFKPNIMWSTDEGATWTKSKVFITKYPFQKNNRPYVKYFSDGISKIHIVFTDGHPRVEPTNSVYYVLFENGKFYKADGELVRDLETIPFEPGDASAVYRSNEEEGRAWIADIGQDDEENPVILYTRSPDETNHEYWYARYSPRRWINKKICDSGKWFPQTRTGEKEREPHYFGNMTIHPDDCNVVYLSRQVNGVFEIERWETADDGNSWEIESVTQNSKYDNVRPFVPRGLKADQEEIVLWMENQKYIHYTNYETSIKFNIRKN